ncbi:tRNA glutamyl-Q(34) synthetase GluQRS [Gammaproteobacteria bacterium 42_54_T18]|nr:tRNA glutamyl-Q(34) synthetase GluQRS [Gammaproteobacteria bacterium 42_54_T18]
MLNYIGRFAPSPSGPLHFGSLLTAVASYLDAKHNDGSWLVRMDDLDPPREIPGAADNILSTLDAYGLHWDGEITYQSQRHDLYEAAVQSLLTNNQAFYCTCSRKQLAEYSSQQDQPTHSPYPGTCREQHTPPNIPFSIRLTTEGAHQPVCINDKLQGRFCQNLITDVGDFIIKRKDLLYAYHLAAVIDDHWQKISHIVRGIDLLDSTPRQTHLQQLLGYNTPHYAHLPVVVNEQGQKLSKQTFAKAIETTQCSRVLWTALSTLGLKPPTLLQHEPPEAILKWGTLSWSTKAIINVTRINSTQITIDV